MTITVTEDEVNAIRYALTALANRRAEQSIEQQDQYAGEESRLLRALAERIVKESQSHNAAICREGGQPK